MNDRERLTLNRADVMHERSENVLGSNIPRN